jgi:hypothetical protein
LRAELLGQIVGAQFELEGLITSLPAEARGEGERQLRALKDLQRQIGSASPATLNALRAEVGSTVMIAQAAVQQARVTAETSALLTEASSAGRQQVTALMQDMHRFDAYLHFASPEDEEDYRRHEAERRAYIDAQLAKGTPEGNLNASGGAVGQMLDAKAHGAGESPEFQQRWSELVAHTETLRDALRRSGHSTAEFDEHLRDELRRLLKSKGLSDMQIEARFAANPDPLEAAKAYVADGDLSSLGHSLAVTDMPQPPRAQSAAVPAELDLDGAMAKLRASGLTASDHPVEQPFAHGVTEHAQPASAPSRSVSG